MEIILLGIYSFFVSLVTSLAIPGAGASVGVIPGYPRTAPREPDRVAA